MREVRVSAGAGFVVTLLVTAMPGLPKISAEHIDVLDDGCGSFLMSHPLHRRSCVYLLLRAYSWWR